MSEEEPVTVRNLEIIDRDPLIVDKNYIPSAVIKPDGQETIDPDSGTGKSL